MATRTGSKAAGIAFGRKLVYASTRKLEYTVSEDDKAFEIRFETAIAAGVGSPSFASLKKSTAPIGTNVFTAVIPASGKNVKTAVSLNGFCETRAGTSVTLMAMANDEQVVKHFRNSKDNKGFTLSVPVQARSLSEIRLTVLLVAQQEGAGDASALIAVSDIGADTFRPKKRVPVKNG